MTRKRSFWGWGWEDRFPDLETRRGMGMQVQALLGAELSTEEPPRLDEIEIRPSRLKPPEALAAFTTDHRESRIRRTYGRGYRDVLRGFRRDFALPPDLVARPENEAEVAAVLEWASENRVAVIPYGGGTSVVGGVEPDVGGAFRGTLTLDLERLTGVLEVDRQSLAARIAAGTLGPALEDALAGHGLTLRCFPQSFEFSTLGGWIATRAGGHFATLYTHIDDLVESTRMLTPRGPMETRRLPASGAGPSPDRMVLGSEGTLGVVTEAWVRVRPRPTFRSAVTVRFDDYERAVGAVRALAQSGLHPSNCRLLDSQEAALNFVSNDGSHVLIVGFESADHPLEPWMARALEIALDHGGVCPDGPVHRAGGERSGTAGGAGSWRAAFLDAPYLWNVLISLGVVVDTFETACTWDRFEALHAEVTRRVGAAMREHCGGGLVTCRFTHVYPDGPAPYFTFVAPGRRGAELEQWAAIKRAASDALIEMGGTITHHHAVGRLHRPHYERQRPPLFADALSAVKRALDPAGVLNPGVLLGAP